MMGNAKNFFAWILLYSFAILLIVMGVQGSAGRVLAVALCPSKLDVTPATWGPYGKGSPFGNLPNPGPPGSITNPFGQNVYT